MRRYRAIVSITFDDEDLNEFADRLGVKNIEVRADETVDGMLDNLEIGSAWVEQLFENGQPTIARLSGGIIVEVNPHETG